MDRMVADPLQQADHRAPAAGARLREPGHFREATEPAAKLHRHVNAGIAERGALVQPQE